MRTVSDLILRRAAALRELASLGFCAAECAGYLDVDPVQIAQLRKRFKIEIRDGRGGKGWLQKLIIRDFGKEGMTTSAMAERYGATANSVGATICRLRKAGKLPRTDKQKTELAFVRISAASNYGQPHGPRSPKPANMQAELEANP